jgi:hypothetical protein
MVRQGTKKPRTTNSTPKKISTCPHFFLHPRNAPPLISQSGKITLRRKDMMINMLDALNARAMMPYEWMWRLPLAIFTKEKQAFEVVTNMFEELIEKHKVEKNSQGGKII